MARNIPITLQKFNIDTQAWGDFLFLHAYINKASNGVKNNQYLDAGSERSKVEKVFEITYQSRLTDIECNTQSYRIIYDGKVFNIVDYDDYKEYHKKIRLLGECSNV